MSYPVPTSESQWCVYLHYRNVEQGILKLLSFNKITEDEKITRELHTITSDDQVWKMNSTILFTSVVVTL